MQDLETVLSYICKSIEKIKKRLEKIEVEVLGFSSSKVIMEHSGKKKFLFSNDFGFSPNQVLYKIKGKEFLALIDNGEIFGAHIKEGKINSRVDGQSYGSIIFETSLDRGSKVSFEKSTPSTKEEIKNLKDEIIKIRLAAKSMITGLSTDE